MKFHFIFLITIIGSAVSQYEEQINKDVKFSINSFAAVNSTGYEIKFAINGTSAYPSLYHLEITCIMLSTNTMSKQDIYIRIAEANIPVNFEMFCSNLVPGSLVEAGLYLVDSNFFLKAIIAKTNLEMVKNVNLISSQENSLSVNYSRPNGFYNMILMECLHKKYSLTAICNEILTTCTCLGLLPADEYSLKLITVKTGFENASTDLIYAKTMMPKIDSIYVANVFYGSVVFMWNNPAFNPSSLKVICESKNGSISSKIIPGDMTTHQCFSLDDIVKFTIISNKQGFTDRQSDTFVFSRSEYFCNKTELSSILLIDESKASCKIKNVYAVIKSSHLEQYNSSILNNYLNYYADFMYNASIVSYDLHAYDVKYLLEITDVFLSLNFTNDIVVTQKNRNFTNRILVTIKAISHIIDSTFHITMNNLDISLFKKEFGTTPAFGIFKAKDKALPVQFLIAKAKFINTNYALYFNPVMQTLLTDGYDNFHMAFTVFLSQKIFMQTPNQIEIETATGRYMCPKSLISLQAIAASVTTEFTPTSDSFTVSIFTEFEDLDIQCSNENTVERSYSCVYWDYNMNQKFGGWNDKSCIYILNNSLHTCLCNRVGIHALIINLDYKIVVDCLWCRISAAILTILSVAVSILILTVGLGILIKAKTSSLQSDKLLFQLHTDLMIAFCVNVIALNCMYLVFFYENLDKQAKNSCIAIGVLLQFFMLNSCLWLKLMIFFRLIEKVKYLKKFSHYFLLSLIYAYGFPLILIMISVLLGTENYLRPNDLFCSLQDIFIAGFILTPYLVSLVTSIVFICVIARINYRDRKLRILFNECKQEIHAIELVYVVFAIKILYGLTWITAYSYIPSSKENLKGFSSQVAFFIFNFISSLFTAAVCVYLYDPLVFEAKLKKPLANVKTLICCCTYCRKIESGERIKSKTVALVSFTKINEDIN